jgi:plasmid stabilization system protein ParE
MLPLDFLPGAQSDFDDSFDWYAERSPLVAVRFANAVEEVLRRIATDPDQFASIDLRHRECLVRRFPFRIVYRNEADRILVGAIVHAKRRPNYWRNRRKSQGMQRK